MTKHRRFNEITENTMSAQASAAVAFLARGNRRDLLKTRLMQSVFFLILIIGVLSASTARAGDAGLAVFVTGKVEMAGKPLALNSTVAEGAELSTGADGYVYIKTIDNGFFILRPNTRARIVTYHVDQKDPINTRIKLELITGVARSISGEAVKLARQNFRFNTPVAAIGVRGTDFVVYTTQETSRIAVVSGGVVASAFVSGCAPQGFGPCEGSSSTELFARQRGQLLQITKEQSKPQLLQGGAPTPDTYAPPRSDEPIGKVSAPVSTSTSFLSGSNNGSSANTALPVDILDPKKINDLKPIIAESATSPIVAPVIPPIVSTPAPPPISLMPVPSVMNPPAVSPPVAPETPQIIWGRWTDLLGKPATIDIKTQSDSQSKIVAINNYYVLFRTNAPEYQAPSSGILGFSLKESQAVVFDERDKALSAASIENGKLQIDFSKASFSTSFDLISAGSRYALQAQGLVSSSGLLIGENQYNRPTNAAVNGLVTNQNGGTAAYLFQSRLDDNRLASGVTFWGKKQ